ncbi:MAG TPA: Gfo/Idh/MocA family oxidoreductase [Kiritimatiellia bacterium]|nr:Gfo/Idh/MocA family oxidoreductase [Kiritimatiellia bacterium]
MKIAIIGTGGMANAHAGDIKRNKHTELVAAADVDLKKAKDFAVRHGVPHVFDNQTELLEKVAVDAVINVTPDAFHAPLSLEAIAAGKHVLCEKPLATGYPDARRMATAAKRKGIVNMVNFSYRNSPAIQKARILVQKGAIGRPMHFEASYLQSWLATQIWGEWRTSHAWLWRLSTAHGSSGALGDIGVHILDFASMPLGDYAAVHCRLKAFDKAPGGKIGKYRLDANDSAIINAEMKNGALGVVHVTRWATGQRNSLRLRVYGEEGALIVDLDKGYSQLETCFGKNRIKAEWKTVTCAKTPSNFERFVDSIRTGNPQPPDFAQGARIQQVMDACFASGKSGKTVKVG